MRTLARRVRRLRRIVVLGDLALSVTPVVVGAVLITGAGLVVLRAYRGRAARPPLAGAGDDKPPGFENPTSDDPTGRGAHTAL